VQNNYLPVVAELGKVERRESTITDEDGREHGYMNHWVRYRYEVDGRRFSGEDYLPDPGGMPTATIYYDRNNPQTSVGRKPKAERDLSRFVIAGFLAVVALGFGGAALAVAYQQP
jgi:hypothetical protein